MPTYHKKVQVLLTDKQYTDLEEIASRQGKKLGTIVREAIEEYHLKKKKRQEITDAVDRLLSLPPVPVPKTWEELEEELVRAHTKDVNE